MQASAREAVLTWGDQVLRLTNFENDPDEEHWLTRLDGWFGGVGTKGDQPQRELGHGLFPRDAVRTGRDLTLAGSLFFRLEEWRDLADRYVSGILWDGTYGTLTYTVEGLELSTRVRLDGEVKHATKGHQWIDFEVPLVAADPFLYAPARVVQVTPPGYGEGIRWAGGPLEGDVLRFYGGPPPGGVLTNAGNADAWPVITVRGSWPNGVRIRAGRRAVHYPFAVWPQAPLTIDMRRGALTMGGVDVTHEAVRRDWIKVPPRGVTTVYADQFAPSSGWADCTIHDTYI